MITRAPLPLALVCLLSAPAFADDWSDALHAEFERGDRKAAIKLYRKVAKQKGPRAAQARLRRIDLLAKEGKTTALKGAIDAFLLAHPGHTRAAKLKAAKKDAAAYVKRVQARPDPKAQNAKVRKLLKTRRVTLNFPDTPVTEVVSFLGDITGVSVVALGIPDDASVSLRLKNQVLEDAMLEIVKGAKLAYDVIGGVVVIGKNPAALRRAAFTKKQIAANPNGYLKLKTVAVSLNFDGTPLKEAAGFISDITGLQVTVGAGVTKATVSIRLKNTRLDDALTLMTAGAGAEVKLTAAGLRLAKRKTTK